MDDLIAVAAQVGAAFEGIGIRYFIGGSVASSLQGEPRSTHDLDIVAELTVASVPGFAAALGSSFDVDLESLTEAAHLRRSWNIFHVASLTKVDLFVCGTTAFDRSEMERRRRITVEGSVLFIKSPEDTVLRKLLWFRQGGEVSSSQWRDVLSVLRAQRGQLDLAYLSAWDDVLGVRDLLERARLEASR